MKVNKEMFNSLKQLDRIEYRQKQDRIEEAFPGLFSLTSLISWSYVLFLVGACVLTSSLFGYQAAQTVFIKVVNYVYIAFACVIFSFCYDISKSIIKNKALRDLNEEYFKVEVKNGRRSK